ncbi:hypothetical protein C5688_18920 [Methylocystis sp. MitZ-2018]|nr:hypothetical protein C5688_18920 [Methylocystis sp. MitZ-2018]
MGGSQMMQDWYPKSVSVGPEGVPATYEFLKSAFTGQQHFCYSEFGIYRADTAENVCKLFKNATLYLFDFEHNVEHARQKLSKYDNKINYYSNTQKYNDSYNWSLMKLIGDQNGASLFDYCFLDGAHTVAVDALNFFLCDRLLRVGGYMDFDDYNWRLRGSSLDPQKVPQISEQYTNEQIESYQVKMIVDLLVKPNSRYKEVVPQKIYQKIAD